MIALVVEFVASAGNAEAVQELLQTQAANSLKNEEACRYFDVCTDPDASGRFVLYEVYDNEAAVDAHRETDYYATFREKLDPLVASRNVQKMTRL